MSTLLILLPLAILWLAAVAGLRFWAQRRPGRTRPGDFWRDVLAGGMLFLLMLGFFWRTLSGDVYQPADGGDLVSFLYPTYRFAAHELSQGRLPLWNPTLYGGGPFIGDIQAGFLYLPNLALFLANPQFPYTAMQWMAVLHLFWAGLGMYVLVRTLRWPDQPSRLAALLAGVAFMLCDPLFIHLGNLNLIAVLSWLPWTLAAYVVALRAGSLRWAAATALLFAAGTYAGHAQSTFYVALALVFCTLAWPLVTGWRAVNWRRLAMVALVAGGLALLLIAPVLLPALELSRYTVRSEFTYQDAINYSLAPTQALVGLVTPGFFGRGPALHWSLWQRVELPYLGVVTLILALAALLLAGKAQRRQLWLWAALALFGLLVALGVYGIVHGWLTALLPLFGQFRAPARALILWALGVSVLAAAGFDLVVRPAPGENCGSLTTLLRWGAALLVIVAAPLSYLALLLTQNDETLFLRASLAALAISWAALFWLLAWLILAALRRNRLSPTLGGVLLITLLFFDLTATGAYTDISPTDPTRSFQHQAIFDFLAADKDLFRIDTDTDIAALWQPDTAALAGLQDVSGVANPLLLRSVRDFAASTGGRGTPRYNLWNVKYVLVREGTPLPEGKFERVLGPVDGLEVHRNLSFVPRAWVAPADANLSNLEPPAQPSGAQVVAYAPTAITVKTSSAAPGNLILSETDYPGWQAQVNGQRVAITPVNGIFRAVPVPAGAVTVTFTYRPASFTWGVGLAALGLVLALAALCWPRQGRA